MAHEGKLVVMDVDYSSTVDEKVAECEKLAKVCNPYANDFIVR